jgi:MFS family permease
MHSLFAALRPRARTRHQTTENAVRRLATARFISMAGTDATGVAIGFAMYAQTHSAQWLSLSLMLTIGAGALLSPFGGKAGDLFDRRRLMIGAELAAAAVFITLALVHTPAALLALGVVATAIGTVFGPASGAAIAHVAGEHRLSWANGIIAMASNVGKTVGRFGAGVVIAAVGAGSVFLLDAMTFLASAWLLSSIHRAFSAPLTAPTGDDATAEAPAPRRRRSGMRTITRSPKLRLILLSSCISTFATAFSMTAEVPLVFEVGAGAMGLGALTACWTAGMIVGSWSGSRRLHRDNEATGVLVGRIAMSAGVGLVALSPSLPPMLACYVLGGVGGGFMGVAAQSLILRNVPDHVRASTLGAIDSARNVTFGLGVIGAGSLVSLLGARPVYGMVGLVMALGAVPIATLVARLGGLRPLRRAPVLAPATAV